MPLSFDISPVQSLPGLRQRNYPTNGDQIGMLVKFAKALKEALPAEVLAAVPADVMAEVDAVIAEVDAVKETYPKPEGTEP